MGYAFAGVCQCVCVCVIVSSQEAAAGGDNAMSEALEARGKQSLVNKIGPASRQPPGHEEVDLKGPDFCPTCGQEYKGVKVKNRTARSIPYATSDTLPLLSLNPSAQVPNQEPPLQIKPRTSAIKRYLALGTSPPDRDGTGALVVTRNLFGAGHYIPLHRERAGAMEKLRLHQREHKLEKTFHGMLEITMDLDTFDLLFESRTLRPDPKRPGSSKLFSDLRPEWVCFADTSELPPPAKSSNNDKSENKNKIKKI